MSKQIHHRHVGDTLTVLPLQLKQDDVNGVPQVVDLTGLSVSFRMVNHAGVVIVSDSTSRVTVTDSANGELHVDFEPQDVASAGNFYGYITVTDTGESDTFPILRQNLVISINAD
jgi:hypothetical protein